MARDGKHDSLPLLLVFSVTLFGVVKIFVGISRGKPVLFLVLLSLVSALIAAVGFGRAVHRSRKGERALEQLREANAALKFQFDRRIDEFQERSSTGLGLFGLGS